ncbi:bifunctional lysylphosphatidylglycerol flippase/synthetase MprF [Aureimonas flava]|uniref:Bifunctional lysylphosphatidylglycerol flippase/synthetase MprF n=1 Tax=Aureimonas flava TaxID=2320271 RepID=A0A3A1WUY5_9HYPH|nr:bifunctional lysylphosphatidylglycerol flippase/synthetase MprF [Aureimonas flava]RIY01910.1 bifunctional lysylphosphatidylglycerol flippase/synthetase MprF [Aureimonas flava]
MSVEAEITESAAAPRSGRGWKTWVPVGIGLAITVVAFATLHTMMSTLSLGQIHEAVTSVPAPALLLAVFFTVVSFAAVSLYDVVAVETIAPGRVSRPVAATVGAAGYAISNALGFPLLTGGALRYHAYKSGGIELADIGRIVGTSWFALWFALAIMLGIALMVDPSGIPFLRDLDHRVDLILGIVIVALVALFVAWLSRGAREVRIGRFHMALPSHRGALVQLVAGIVDVGAAAAVLYVLMPPGTVGSFLLFSLVFAVATVVGVASSAPGGLGAFEATLLVTLGLSDRADVVAALVLYRLIYTVLPLVVTVVGLAVIEVFRRRGVVAGPAKELARAVEPIVPPAVAALTFGGGLVLLASGVLPSVATRIGILGDIVPLPFIEMSQLAASFVGVALLIVARGLAKRLWRAWVVSLALLLAGAVFALSRGLDWEEAVLLVIQATLLLGFRRAFYRRSVLNPFALTWSWLAAVLATVMASIWLGFFAYRHVEYANTMWWDFALDADAPRFLRASVVAIAIVAAVGLDVAIHRRTERIQRFSAIPPEVAPIVAGHPSTVAWLALLGDKRFLFSPDRRGFVMYARSGGSLVALGEPVGPPDVVAELAWSFRDLADRQAERTVFYQVGPQSLPLFLDMGLSALKLGEVARVDLPAFKLEGQKMQNLRTAIRRAEREGLEFEIIGPETVQAEMDELRAVSDAWLQSKSGSEKGFSLGYFDEKYLGHFDMAILRKDGAVVAFANLWRGSGKEELSIDLMRFLPDVSRVLMDVLFAKLLMYGKDEGYRWFNLGAAPLSGLVDRRGASRWNRFGSFLYRRGGNFYHFDGLKGFKQKFNPVWTPHYLICPGGFDTAKCLVDVTALISGRPKQDS